MIVGEFASAIGYILNIDLVVRMGALRLIEIPRASASASPTGR
jgi:hypothetical protein